MSAKHHIGVSTSVHESFMNTFHKISWNFIWILWFWFRWYSFVHKIFMNVHELHMNTTWPKYSFGEWNFNERSWMFIKFHECSQRYSVDEKQKKRWGTNRDCRKDVHVATKTGLPWERRQMKWGNGITRELCNLKSLSAACQGCIRDLLQVLARKKS